MRALLSAWVVVGGVVGGLVVAAPSVAGADLVTVRGGRVISVTECRFEGDTAILVLRTGGEMRAPRDFVLDVQPDEVPWPEPAVAATADVPKDELRRLVDRLAAQHGVDTRLAHAVVQVESNYQPRAVSPKGAMGLMQLMPATARQYALDDPFDPARNLDAGLRHLRGLLDRYGQGRESLALAAYNAGDGAVSRYQGIPPYRETRNYVQRILSLTGR